MTSTVESPMLLFLQAHMKQLSFTNVIPQRWLFASARNVGEQIMHAAVVCPSHMQEAFTIVEGISRR